MAQEVSNGQTPVLHERVQAGSRTLAAQFRATGGPGARELGVRRNQLYKWDEQFKTKGTDEVFPGPGRRVGAAGELARLHRENARLQEENEILKKAARYFARASA